MCCVKHLFSFIEYIHKFAFLGGVVVDFYDPNIPPVYYGGYVN